MSTGLRLTILCEDQATMGFLDRKFLGQHGLSILVESDRRILFDTGPSEVVLANARLCGCGLGGIEWIVLSHGHWDHADGLAALASAGVYARLLVHPGVFADRHRQSGEYNGMAMSRAQAAARFDLIESASPRRISESVWFLGEVPRANDFEAQSTTFYCLENGCRRPDLLPDDTALAIHTAEGLVIVTGCSHAGVCNICEHARLVTGEDRLHMVIGGFHLLDDSEIVAKSVAYFRDRRVARLYPMHCTALPALARFHAAFGSEKLCAGDVIEIF